MKLAAGCWVNHGIYMSGDAGLTWQPVASAAANWTALVASADGSRWLGVDFTNGVFTLQTHLSPTLNIANSGGNLVLSWLLPSETFGLEANSDLNTTNWTAVPGTPVLNLTNLQYSLSVSPAAGSQFFAALQPGNDGAGVEDKEELRLQSHPDKNRFSRAVKPAR